MDAKHLLRTQLKHLERTMRGHDFSLEDEASCRALLSSTLYQTAQWIFAFHPLDSEVNILPVLEDARKHKHLALPVCMADGTMQFHPFDPQQDMHKSALGILEPERTHEVFPDHTTLLIIPAMAYTKFHERLGRGKGYYDRYLSIWRDAATLGICRSHQLQNALPLQAWDMQVDKVLCNGVFY
ncbi:5-formyltetrahydrofolate cyclo-ligase [Sphaerochaeta sp.]|uniref:5-formyltetrahydrofolate cyclo-ligase n=1 Tax=Sphaerochaeta sp. TaxID=1972642 RepID=UPI002FCC3CF1